jgi:hypothetical protein
MRFNFSAVITKMILAFRGINSLGTLFKFLKLLLGKNYKLLFPFVSIFVSRNIAIESTIFLGMKKSENVGSSLDAGKKILTSFMSNFYFFVDFGVIRTFILGICSCFLFLLKKSSKS